jgi:hypothetical protein
MSIRVQPTPQAFARVVAVIRAGGDMEAAATAVGCRPCVIFSWQRRFAGFRQAMQDARAQRQGDEVVSAEPGPAPLEVLHHSAVVAAARPVPVPAPERDTRVRADEGKLADAVRVASKAVRSLLANPKWPDADPRFSLPDAATWGRLRAALHAIASPSLRRSCILALLLEVERRDRDDRAVTLSGRVALGHHGADAGGAP